MNIEKILYIVPSSNRVWKKRMRDKVGTLPIGVAGLSSLLKLHGYNVKIIDLLVEDISPTELKDAILAFKPDIVGVSASFTECITNAFNIMKLVKKYLDCPLIAGGVHTTFCPEEVLNNGADYVILHEGESSTVKLIECLKAGFQVNLLSKIQGIGYWKDGEICLNNENCPVEDLDSLPFYDFYGLKLDRYATPMALMTSRGCPGDCIYCASRAMFGKKYRLRSAESVISEAFLLHKNLINYENVYKNYLTIFDDTFTANKTRLSKFCRYMIDTELNKKVVWKCESRIDILTEEIIIQMKEAGCIAIHVGLESTNQEIINSLNKHINVDKMEQVIQMMIKHNVEPLCSFIIGNHKDTKETLETTIEFIKKIVIQYGAVVATSPNTPLPGTELFNNPEKYGITIKSKSWGDYSLLKVIIDTDHLTQEEIRNYNALCTKIIAKGNKDDV